MVPHTEDVANINKTENASVLVRPEAHIHIVPDGDSKKNQDKGGKAAERGVFYFTLNV